MWPHRQLNTNTTFTHRGRPFGAPTDPGHLYMPSGSPGKEPSMEEHAEAVQ